MAIDQGSLRYGQGSTVTTVETRNRVLRNTYWLLALSMIPTVIGAWIGVTTGFSFFAGSPFIGLIAFLAIAFGFMYGINRYKDSSIGTRRPIWIGRSLPTSRSSNTGRTRSPMWRRQIIGSTP